MEMVQRGCNEQQHRALNNSIEHRHGRGPLFLQDKMEVAGESTDEGS